MVSRSPIILIRAAMTVTDFAVNVFLETLPLLDINPPEADLKGLTVAGYWVTIAAVIF